MDLIEVFFYVIWGFISLLVNRTFRYVTKITYEDNSNDSKLYFLVFLLILFLAFLPIVVDKNGIAFFFFEYFAKSNFVITLLYLSYYLFKDYIHKKSDNNYISALIFQLAIFSFLFLLLYLSNEFGEISKSISLSVENNNFMEFSKHHHEPSLSITNYGVKWVEYYLGIIFLLFEIVFFLYIYFKKETNTSPIIFVLPIIFSLYLIEYLYRTNNIMERFIHNGEFFK